MRRTRLLSIILLTAALAPGLWWRAPEPPRDFQRSVTIRPLAITPERRGPFTLSAAWELTGDRLEFGGFSALVARDDRRFLAGSDTGRRLQFERPDRSVQPGVLGRFGDEEASAKVGRDLESLAVDPAGGTVWGGYEYRKSIVRFDARFNPDAEVRPAGMRDWEDNAGAETLVRLADGRFLVVEERARRGRGRHHALVFATDPVKDRDPARAIVGIPAGYRPVDGTPIGGGQALVLLRRVVWGIPPGFESAIAHVNIDRRNPDGSIAARLVTEFGDAIPQENYEGLALTRDHDGTHLWLISDDNFMSTQRTLLLKLRWDQREKARE